MGDLLLRLLIFVKYRTMRLQSLILNYVFSCVLNGKKNYRVR